MCDLGVLQCRTHQAGRHDNKHRISCEAMDGAGWDEIGVDLEDVLSAVVMFFAKIILSDVDV